MRLVTVAGPPSCGKTSLMTKTCAALREKGLESAVVKFDCLQSRDDALYAAAGIPVSLALSGGLCPDHFFATNLEEAFAWAAGTGAQCCIIETAGLCNRCSPHLRGALALCVIDNLMGIDAPEKIGPMLRLADVVVVTKGDSGLPGRAGGLPLPGATDEQKGHHPACKRPYGPGLRGSGRHPGRGPEQGKRYRHEAALCHARGGLLLLPE